MRFIPAKFYFCTSSLHPSFEITYTELARIAFSRGNMKKSVEYLESYLYIVPDDKMAIQNYVLLLLDTGQAGKAYSFIKEKQKAGIFIPQDLVNAVEAVTRKTAE